MTGQNSSQPEPGQPRIDTPLHSIPVNESTVDLLMEPSGPTPPSGTHSSVALEDWHELFIAVQARLKQTVVEQLAVALPNRADALERVCAVVMECLVELEQLHGNMKHELLRYPEFEGQLSNSQKELAQVHDEH